MQEMETRYIHSPEDIRHYSAEQPRKEFLVEKVFEPGKISLTYTHNGRMISGGVTPIEKELEITLGKELGVDYFLERREPGVINIGGSGFIGIDGQKEEMKKQDGYYIGKETRHAIFSSQDAENPAKSYINSAPTYHKYPNAKISIDQIKLMETGEGLTLDERKIHQHAHPNVRGSCQLQMGYTILESGSARNTMPCHTHERCMEAYVYFDYTNEDTRVSHTMGRPDETKCLAVDNEQAIVPSSWSIRSGVGINNYSFIWAICGENITYTDMDTVQID